MGATTETLPAIILCAAVASLVSASTAGADNAPQAERLFRDGKRFMEQGKLAEACEAFAASQKLDPSVSTLMNLADCHEKGGRFASAWGAFVAVERQTRDDDRYVALHRVAGKRAASLDRRLSYLVVQIEQPADGLVVLWNGAALDPGAWDRPLPVDGGDHVVVVRAPGRVEWTGRVTVAPANDRRSLVVPPLATPASAPRAPPRIRVDSTLYAGAGGFVTSGAIGLELGVSYGLAPRWDVHGSYLRGQAQTSFNGSTYPISLNIARLRVTRHFPRASRVQPFLGASLLVDHASIGGAAVTTPGIAIEPGLVFAASSTVRVFVQLPIGFVQSQTIHWIGPSNQIVPTQIDAFFGGIAAGAQVGGRI